MKRIHPEDPRVTAHALGELPANEAAEVERAAASNPDIQAALEETHALASLIRSSYKAESHELGEARREAIRRAGRRPAPENLVSMNPRRQWVKPALVSAAAAVLVACAVWMMQQVPRGEDGLTDAEREQSQRAALRTQMLLSPAPRPDLIGPGQSRTVPSAPSSSLYQLDEPLSQNRMQLLTRNVVGDHGKRYLLDAIMTKLALVRPRMFNQAFFHSFIEGLLEFLLNLSF